MTLSWPGSSTALRRCAVSGMALTPSSQQLMSRFHPNHVTTIPSSACRTLVLSSILGRTSGKGNANTFQGLVTVISYLYNTARAYNRSEERRVGKECRTQEVAERKK